MGKKDKAKTLAGVFVDAGQGFSQHRASNMAAAVAFYAILSSGPLLVVILAIADTFWGRKAAAELILSQLSQYVGDDAARTLSMAAENSRVTGAGIAYFISLIMLVWTSTLLLSSVRFALRTIWEKRLSQGAVKSYFRQRGASLLTVIIIGVALLLSTIVMNGLAIFSGWIGEFLPWIRNSLIIDWMIWVVWFTLLVALLFKTLAGRTINWGAIFFGATVTAILFVINRELLALYINRVSNASSYGAAGSLASLSLWVYVSALAMFFGAECTRAWKQR